MPWLYGSQGFSDVVVSGADELAWGQCIVVINRLPFGTVKPKVMSSSAVLCSESSGEGSEEAKDLLGHLLCPLSQRLVTIRGP